MTTEKEAGSSVDGKSSIGKYAQKMTQLQRDRHMLLISLRRLFGKSSTCATRIPPLISIFECWKEGRTPSPTFEDAEKIDKPLLAMCQSIAKDPDVGHEATEKLNEARDTLHKIRGQYEVAISDEHSRKLHSNPHFFETLAFLTEENHMRTAYIVAKRVVEGREIPEELVQMIVSNMCQERSNRLGAMRKVYQKDLKKMKTKQSRQ
ncbi:hypothetical protein M409DRAFT_56099 [Zasmidium cellare ATCC 36951]|uniref:Uncharacterized protein n=1 Tax=Zasmidium cellare ATCC 36951 TaxID=1080233 RepID=A0A6A6CDS2_ZASCE|nr:uncharacterized protein M409DRAFT_56099 [Zasmidium cellare ATCC 36951]KAF2165225.1 hypothetical protein M409DRAFT_56099 [Zasmidium cellare ATCC 36951]